MPWDTIGIIKHLADTLIMAEQEVSPLRTKEKGTRRASNKPEKV